VKIRGFHCGYYVTKLKIQRTRTKLPTVSSTNSFKIHLYVSLHVLWVRWGLQNRIHILILLSVFFTLVPPVSTCFFQQIKINRCRTDKCIAIMTNMTYCRAKHNKPSIINSSIPLAVPPLASAFWFTNLMSIRRNNRHFISCLVPSCWCLFGLRGLLKI